MATPAEIDRLNTLGVPQFRLFIRVNLRRPKDYSFVDSDNIKNRPRNIKDLQGRFQEGFLDTAFQAGTT